MKDNILKSSHPSGHFNEIFKAIFHFKSGVVMSSWHVLYTSKKLTWVCCIVHILWMHEKNIVEVNFINIWNQISVWNGCVCYDWKPSLKEPFSVMRSLSELMQSNNGLLAYSVLQKAVHMTACTVLKTEDSVSSKSWLAIYSELFTLYIQQLNVVCGAHVWHQWLLLSALLLPEKLVARPIGNRAIDIWST